MKSEEVVDQPGRKDILDYLRNQQKAAEIESKINGINVWVLCGAISLVGWQLLDSFDPSKWIDLKIILRLCLLTQAAFLLVLSSTIQSKRNDIRLPTTSGLEIPILWFLSAALLGAPPLIFVLLFGTDFPSVTMLSAWGLFSIVLLIEWGNHFSAADGDGSRFPKGDIASTPRQRNSVSLAVGTVAFAALVVQAFEIYKLRSAADLPLIKNAVLSLGLYWLVFFLLRRGLFSQSIRWTYSLEAELIVGSISPQAAIRRIEHRELGPRLSVVMNDFFDELDSAQEELRRAVERFRIDTDAIKDIPAEYQSERNSRLEPSSASVIDQMQKLMSAHREYLDYVKKMATKPTSRTRKDLRSTLEHVNSRHSQYFQRTKALKVEFETLKQSLA